MRIIGIDPGLARVGYGIIDEIQGKKTMLDCGIIKTKSTEKEEKRLVEISNDLSSIINKWDPNYAAVEKFFETQLALSLPVVLHQGDGEHSTGKHRVLQVMRDPGRGIQKVVGIQKKHSDCTPFQRYIFF